jgi:ubiquinone/menaquinone biosynthesis C-methylase UbiE
VITRLTKSDIFHKALFLRNTGQLYPAGNEELDDLFNGSIDRFCEIAFRLQSARKVLDVGSGQGMLDSLLTELGHECHAVDIFDQTKRYSEIYCKKSICFQVCNVEVDSLPFRDNTFDAVVCCQVLEHFTHSHLPVMKEIKRVLKTGGIVEVDVPNAVCFRNRSRMIRGKHITFDYEEHYLRAVPVYYKGLSFYPARHNREFTRKELKLLFAASGFRNIEVTFLKSRRYRESLARIRSIGSAFRDLIPSFRKSLLAFGEKPGDGY